jgi:hypothetical protein
MLGVIGRLANVLARRNWRVFEGGRVHMPGDRGCRSCLGAGGKAPELHKFAPYSCHGLVHFEARATGKDRWEIRSKCDVCGRSVSGTG